VYHEIPLLQQFGEKTGRQQEKILLFGSHCATACPGFVDCAARTASPGDDPQAELFALAVQTAARPGRATQPDRAWKCIAWLAAEENALQGGWVGECAIHLLGVEHDPKACGRAATVRKCCP
jgi:hypothetical protein